MKLALMLTIAMFSNNVLGLTLPNGLGLDAFYSENNEIGSAISFIYSDKEYEKIDINNKDALEDWED